MAAADELWDAVALEGREVLIGRRLLLQHADNVSRVECIRHLDSDWLSEEPAEATERIESRIMMHIT